MTTVEAEPLTLLWLQVTNRCQLHCTHCYAESGPDQSHGSMTDDDWREVIDQAAALNVPSVQFIGGEPTLRPGLPELIRYALAAGVEVEVFTNLAWVPEAMWQVFSLPGVRLATSYYSDDPEQHANITARRTHGRTRDNIAEALRRHIPLRAGVIDLGGEQRARQAQAELVDLGVPRVGYDQVRAVGRAGDDTACVPGELCGGCGLGVAAVDPNGILTPCVFTRRSVPLGDVRTTPLAALLPRLPKARADLMAAGMPDSTQGRPCPPDGENCYPHNCHPRL